jgi:hypothetical protein
MEQLCEVRTRILLEKSADLQNRMAEILALREAVRTPEATLPGPEPIRPAVAPPLPTVRVVRRLVELELKTKPKG